jgi:hypothetical protein
MEAYANLIGCRKFLENSGGRHPRTAEARHEFIMWIQGRDFAIRPNGSIAVGYRARLGLRATAGSTLP